MLLKQQKHEIFKNVAKTVDFGKMLLEKENKRKMLLKGDAFRKNFA